MTYPTKPPAFTPEAAPVGVGVDYVSYWQTRKVITPRIQLAHTNAANREGSIRASKAWAEAAPGKNTLPHYQIDRDGSACKFLPTDRMGIANQTVPEFRGTHGSVQEWSLAYETADTGTLDDPNISAYTDIQGERLAEVFAYEAMVWDIPLALPETWYGSGTASHTDPFGYPWWTNARGKTCPGSKKKAQLRAEILPYAREILAYWTDEGKLEDVTALNTPAVVYLPDGRIDQFVRGGDAKLWHNWRRPGEGWSAWQDLGGILSSSPSAAALNINNIIVSAQGADGKLWSCEWDGADWRWYEVAVWP